MSSLFLSDPEYCTRYYRCSHGIDEIFECPRGTAWDDVTKACSWADQVTCDERKLGYSTSSTTEGMLFILVDRFSPSDNLYSIALLVLR
jgi:hypothetical protein